MHGLKLMTHYHFREKVALTWLDEERFWPERYSRRPKINTECKSRKMYVSATASSAQVTLSVVSSTNTSVTLKSCKALNQNSLENRSTCHIEDARITIVGDDIKF